MQTPGCYCGLWHSQPELLAQQGMPRGHCGRCSVCGTPGHTRHHPGAVPVTGAWCDRHYRRLALLHPTATPGWLLWATLVGGAVLLLRGCLPG